MHRSIVDDGAIPLKLDTSMIQRKHQEVIFGTVFVILGIVSREVPSVAKSNPAYKLGRMPGL